jgi:hypothetical protein
MNNTLTLDETIKLAQNGSQEGHFSDFAGVFLHQNVATAQDIWRADAPLFARIFILESGNMLPTQFISGVKNEMNNLVVNKDVAHYINFQASGTLWKLGYIVRAIRNEQKISYADAFAQVEEIVHASISGYLGV